MSIVVGVANAAVSEQPVPSAQTNGRVYAIAVVGNIAYIGGQFTRVRPAGATSGGVTRNHAAAIDLTTGAVTSWDPNVNNTIQSIAASGGNVYLGGLFTAVGGKPAQRLAAVSASTGGLVWKATLDKQVISVTVGHGLVYAGGYFTTANGTARSHLAAFDQVTGALNAAWTPTTDLEVKALVVTADGSRVVVGGDFATLDGAPASHIGAVNATTGASVAWATHEPYEVIDMDVDANGVYVAGGGDGGNFAKFDPSTGKMAWQGGTDGNIQAIAVLNGLVYVGGHYTRYCGLVGSDRCTVSTPRSKLLDVDAATGTLQAWDPDANSVLGVFALSGGGVTLAAGGDFTRVSATGQQGFAHFQDPSPDTTPPTVTSPPKLIVQLGAELNASTVPTRVSFAATDSSGVCRYTLQQSVNDGAYAGVALPSPTTAYASPVLTPGTNTHRFQVEATDCALNTTGWVSGDTSTLTAFQNGNAAVKYGGAWRTSDVSGAYGGRIASTSAANGSARLTFTGREVAWVASRAANRGAAKVYIDGALASTVNTYSATTVRRRVVFTRTFATRGSHTIRVVCAGTQGHALVDVDAFLVVS